MLAARPRQLDLAHIFGTRLVAWYDASRPRAGNRTTGWSTTVADGSTLELWQSLAISSKTIGPRDLVADYLAGNSPTWRERGLYGKPSVRFDGDRDHMVDYTNAAILSGVVAATAVTVWSTNTATLDGYIWSIPNNVAGTNGFDLRTTTAASNKQVATLVRSNTPAASDLAIGASSDGSAAYNDGLPHHHDVIIEFGKSSNEQVAYGTFSGGNAASVSGASISTNGNALTVGAFSQSLRASTGFNGDLHELMLFDVALSYGQLRMIRRYTQAKWGARLPTYADPY